MAYSYRFWTFCVVLIAGIFTSCNGQSDPIKVVSVIDPPNLMPDGKGGFVGFLPDLLDAILGEMKANYTLTNVSRYGALDNGTWVGMVGEVKEKRADIAGILTVTLPRYDAVDFSYPVASVGPTIVLKRPEKPIRITENLDTLFKPFDFTVWLLTILAFVVTSTALYMISHFNPYEWRRMFKDREATLREAESFTCMNSFWFALSALSWQGYIRAPRSVGGRLVVTGWWFFVLLLILSYLASLTNLLRMGPQPLEAKGYSKIRGFSDLAQASDVKVLVVPNGSTESHFKSSQDATEKIISSRIQDTKKSVTIGTTQEGLQELRTSPFADIAMILESTTAKYYTNRKPCDLYMVSEHLITSHHAFAFQKGSTISGEFNRELVKMRESGELRALDRKWFGSQAECGNYVVDSEVSGAYDFNKFYKLDLGAFFGAVLILGIALLLGGLVTLVEVFIFKWAETRVDEDDPKEGAEAEASNKLIDGTGSRGGATQV